jgi:hypothetical protein
MIERVISTMFFQPAGWQVCLLFFAPKKSKTRGSENSDRMKNL